MAEHDLEKVRRLAREGKVELANPEAAERMMAARRAKVPRDYTVTEAAIQAAWEHDGGKGIIVTWGTVSAGFGELTLHIDGDGKLTLDTETMGREFAQAVFKKLLDDAETDNESRLRASRVDS